MNQRCDGGGWGAGGMCDVVAQLAALVVGRDQPSGPK